jgi:site-specific recombinase XerD
MSNSPDSHSSAHITTSNLLIPTLNAWRYYMEDQGLSQHTIKAFSADLRLLTNYLPADRSLGAITTPDLLNFLDWMQSGRGVPCSPKTLSRRITSIKAFFRWLHSNGVLLLDPAEKVPQKSVISPIPEVLTSQEFQSVLETADNFRHRPRPDARPYTLVALLLYTGIKKGECVSISPNHIELDAEGGPFLFVRYATPQNRYKERKIDLPDSWVAAYHEYLIQYTPTEKLFPWSARRLEYLLEDIGAEAGLTKHLSFDMCRWTCALSDWQAAIEPDKIRQKLGVSKIQWHEVKMKLQQLAKG